MQRNLLIKIVFFLFFIIPANSEIIKGAAVVVDGDTLKIDNKRIRLHGIDAPEIKQLCRRIYLSIFFLSFSENYECGKISKKKLEGYTQNYSISCKVEGIDRYKRILGTCFKDKININSRMVRLGHAVAYKKYSKKYLSAEREAKREKLGLWKGTFDMPWDWRKNVKK